MTEGTRRLAGSMRALSAKPIRMISSRSPPTPASAAWMARQPPSASSAAPAVGAIIGNDHRGNGHIGKPGTGGLAVEQVPDDGQRDGHARTGTGPLDRAPYQQARERPGKCAADAGDDEKRAGEQHDGLAAVAVRSRAIEQRRERETEHEQAHDQACLCRSDVECGANGREGRQAHVDAEGWQRDKKAQQQGEGHGGGRDTHGARFPVVEAVPMPPMRKRRVAGPREAITWRRRRGWHDPGYGSASKAAPLGYGRNRGGP